MTAWDPTSRGGAESRQVKASQERTEIVRTTTVEVSNRGNKGATIIRRGTLEAATPGPVELHRSGRE